MKSKVKGLTLASDWSLWKDCMISESHTVNKGGLQEKYIFQHAAIFHSVSFVVQVSAFLTALCVLHWTELQMGFGISDPIPACDL